MINFLIAAGKTLPDDEIISLLENAIARYKKERTQEKIRGIAAVCQLLLVKLGTQDKNIDESIKEFHDFKRLHDLFENKKN